MDQITLIYDKCAPWEFDFISRELLPGSVEVIPFSRQNIDDCASRGSSAVVVAYSANQHDARWLSVALNSLRPNIIINLSDEFYPGHLQEHNELALFCNLFLRQHSHPAYRYHPNTVFLPLGFGSGLLRENERSWAIDVKPVSERGLYWGFVGQLKKDRAEMISAFNSLERGLVETKGVPIAELRKIYSNCIFAPVGSGNYSLDCFRIYEAIILGAIPVVVGMPERVISQLLYISPSLPVLVFETWSEASLHCRLLLEEMSSLQAFQDSMLYFWKRKILGLRKLVKANILPQSVYSNASLKVDC